MNVHESSQNFNACFAHSGFHCLASHGLCGHLLRGSVTRVCWRNFNWNAALISLSHSVSGFDGEAAPLETSVIDAAWVFFWFFLTRREWKRRTTQTHLECLDFIPLLVSRSQSERITGFKKSAWARKETSLLIWTVQITAKLAVRVFLLYFLFFFKIKNFCKFVNFAKISLQF